MRKILVAAVILAATFAGVGTLSVTTTHLDSLELKSYDFLMAVLRGPLAVPDDVAIVAIDESSMKEFAASFAWPWPRSVHAELIRQLGAARARAIVFDVVFDLPSAPAEDADLASAIRESRAPVVLAATIDDVVDAQFHLSQQLRPLPALVEAGAKVGFAVVHQDMDEALRRAPLSVNGAPSLAVAALLAGGHQFDAARVPVFSRGGDPEFFVSYAGPARTIKTVSYYQAIDAAQSLPRDVLAGKTVFVGRVLAAQDVTQGARSKDMFATPFDLQMPGVEIHANAFNTLAHGLFIRRASPAITWLLLLLVGALISVVMLAIRGFRTKLLTAGAIIVVLPVIAAATFVFAGYWLYTVQPVLIATSVFVLNALYQYRASEKDRAFVRKAMTGYVSKQVMQRLLDNPSALELGGVQLDATVLFSDIVGFSSISERMTPPDLTALLNAYFTRIGDAVMAHDGMIDKYIGDAIMAVWGAPLPDEHHAAKACAAALAMKSVISDAGGPLRARIGLNTGPMMAGNLGHRERMAYTVIGDAVNLASRLEGTNKLYGTTILVSDTTVALAADAFIFRHVDRIRVVGKQEPVSIFELLARKEDAGAADLEARIRSFAGIVEAYDRRDWGGALDAVTRHRTTYAERDPVADLYEERCRRFSTAPPPADWDGVYTFTSK